MDFDSLSNVELKKSLESLGYKCGPVTSTTRSLYEKKLAKLMTDGEVVQNRESYSEEVTEVTQNKTEVIKAIEVVDYPPSQNYTFSSPRSYTPDGSNLTRRPLNTPHRKVTSIPKTTTTTLKSNQTSTKTNKPSKGVMGYCKYILPLLVLIALLIILVYYHMEDGMMKELSRE